MTLENEKGHIIIKAKQLESFYSLEELKFIQKHSEKILKYAIEYAENGEATIEDEFI